MPKKYFIIELSDGAEIHVFFETANGLILSFVVKLVFKTGNHYYEVVRFPVTAGMNALTKIFLM